MTRYRYIPAVVAIFICLVGCQSEGDKTLPDEVIGVWKASATGYEDNSLELKKDEILFGVGQSQSNVNSIFKVEKVRSADGRASLIKVYFTDPDGNDYNTSFYYDPKEGGSIRFKNHAEIEWRLAERKVAGGEHVPQRRRTRLLWGLSMWNVTVALLGVALTSGASLWHLKRSRAGEVRRVFAEAPGREPGALMVPSIVAQEQRRSERILLMIRVQVEGIDESGAEFIERTHTLSINRSGAFISLKNLARQGDDISVTNLGTHQTCVFRLCESGKDPSGETTAWGIECLEPEVNFWQIRFPEKSRQPSPERTITTLIVCGTCHSREVADLTVPQYHDMLEKEWMTRDCPDCGAVTEWKFILIETAEAGPEEAPEPSLPSGEENRREKRIVAKLPIRLRHPEDDRVEDSLTENISKSGICCLASMDLSVNDVILLRFEPGTGPSEEESFARIMWRRPMGEGRRTLYGIRLERNQS